MTLILTYLIPVLGYFLFACGFSKLFISEMGSKDKCIKCFKALKDGGIKCVNCDGYIHNKCANVSDELCEVLCKNSNLKYFCDTCIDSGIFLKSCVKIVENGQNEISSKLGELSDLSKAIKTDFEILKTEVKALASSQVKRSEVVGDIKGELKETWSDIVRGELQKSVEGVSIEVKKVKDILDEKEEIVEREKNIILFRFEEGGTKDKSSVMKVLRHLSNNISDEDVLKITRLGRKVEGVIRPLLIKFKDINNKILVMKGRAKIKTLDNNFINIGLEDDLTRIQRDERKKLVEESRDRESNDKNGFLYRVRGMMGKWKIVRFQKKAAQ